MIERREVSRRRLLGRLALGAVAAGGGLVTIKGLHAGQAQLPGDRRLLPSFTGPSSNPYWNSIGPIVEYPQKLPLILMTDRAPQLETPRQYFQFAFTPNAAFYVRWHLD